jgi:hypothetical protein
MKIETNYIEDCINIASNTVGKFESNHAKKQLEVLLNRIKELETPENNPLT